MLSYPPLDRSRDRQSIQKTSMGADDVIGCNVAFDIYLATVASYLEK